MKTLLSHLFRFLRCDDGAAAAQYALLTALVATLTASSLLHFQTELQAALNSLFSGLVLRWP